MCANRAEKYEARGGVGVVGGVWWVMCGGGEGAGEGERWLRCGGWCAEGEGEGEGDLGVVGDVRRGKTRERGRGEVA